MIPDGQAVSTAEMTDALTTSELVFPDGATQTFTPDGHTTYVENGQPSAGEWAIVSDGEFSSFWPPTYRATYAIRWIVERGTRVGVSFTDTRTGANYEGRYRRL